AHRAAALHRRDDPLDRRSGRLPGRVCPRQKRPRPVLRRGRRTFCTARPPAFHGWACCSVSRNSTRCKRGNSRARLRLTRLFPLLGTPSTKFYGKSRTRRYAPRTQFAAKFPCRCRRRRRMSADGDDFRLFRQSAARPPVFHGWAYFLCTFRTIEKQNFRKSLANSVETLGQNR